MVAGGGPAGLAAAAALMCRGALGTERVVQPLQQALRRDGVELGH